MQSTLHRETQIRMLEPLPVNHSARLLCSQTLGASTHVCARAHTHTHTNTHTHKHTHTHCHIGDRPFGRMIESHLSENVDDDFL